MIGCVHQRVDHIADATVLCQDTPPTRILVTLNLLDTMSEFLSRSWCLDCTSETIAAPTLGTAECRLTARLVVQSDVTEQRHRLVLADPKVKAFAPPGNGTDAGSTRYRAAEFDVTIRIENTEITVTPDLARVIAQRETNPEVDRFLDQYGVVTLAEFDPLAHQYADGEMTHRAIAEILDISRAAAFEMLGEVTTILDIEPDSTHVHPGEYDDEEVDVIVENARSEK